MLVPVYGLATLNVPPAGEPDKAIELPEHPLTLPAATIGNGFTVTGCVAVAVHPARLVAVTVYVAEVVAVIAAVVADVDHR